VERGILEGDEVNQAIDEYTSSLLAVNADVFILGCSHYPFLLPALEARLPNHIKFIDTGSAIARRVRQQSLTTPEQNEVNVLTTGDPKEFSRLCEILIPELPSACQHFLVP
jgi:glutamate racemase